MKKFKNILSIIMCLCIVISSTITSGATTLDENRQAFNEFYEIVAAAFSAEGLKLIIEYDENHVYTQKDIDAMLDFLRNNEVVVSKHDCNVSLNNKTRIIPVEFEHTETFDVACLGGFTAYARFELVVKGLYDLQGNNIMSVSPKVRLKSSMNYNSDDLTARYTTNGSKITVRVEGEVLFTLTLIMTDLTFSASKLVDETFVIDTIDYI